MVMDHIAATVAKALFIVVATAAMLTLLFAVSRVALVVLDAWLAASSL